MRKHAFLVCVLVFFAFLTFSYAENIFEDYFNGTELDTSKWSVFVDALGEYNTPYVADGFLQSQGYHTRIDSIPTFAPMEQSVTASARIRIDGILNKFGFAANPWERTGPITGYYFDTVDVNSEPDYVRAIAVGDGVTLLDVAIPVTWNEFHEFAIERTTSEVIYSIDGQEVAQVTDVFANPLPVSVWNDRWNLMQTDWVVVTPEPTTIFLLGLAGLLLRKRKK